MKANIRWLDDPQVLRANQSNAHNDHVCYATRGEVEITSSFKQSLNGTWRFYYSPNPSVRLKAFYKKNFGAYSFDETAVPSHIELANYDKVHYTNTMYPWEGHVFRRPPFTTSPEKEAKGIFSAAEDNPMGFYLAAFRLEEGLRGKQTSIHFASVERAMPLWLSGRFIGYTEDSFTPSEFDLTPYLEEENILVMKVYKRNTTTSLEDQGFFRFFGILREVFLVTRGQNHLEDLWTKLRLNDKCQNGELEVDLPLRQVAKNSQLDVMILDSEGKETYQQQYPLKEQMMIRIGGSENVALWGHFQPDLCRLKLETIDEERRVAEYTNYSSGFYKAEVKDKIIYFNGKRMIINGVNRHEWHPRKGRAITIKDMEKDLAIIKDAKINDVRTSHYPNQITRYYLCDQVGIRVMAETNLESHGSWQKMDAFEPSCNVPGAVPQWQSAVLDWAKMNFGALKSHPSILFWFLGNESCTEENIRQINDYFKKVDPDRLVHYEGNFPNPAFEDSISNVKNRTYVLPEEIIDYLESKTEKSFILYEYMHDMKNSLDRMDSYMTSLDRYEVYQGGYMWDFKNQAIQVTDPIAGREVIRYGGNFDNRPSDCEFSGNGIVSAGGREKPTMQEVRYYYEKYSK